MMNHEDPLKEIRAVVFDSDGTLIDTRPAHRSFYGRLKAELGLPELTSEEENFAFISTQNQIIERIIPPGLKSRANRLAPGLRLQFFNPLIDREPGIVRFLEGLKAKGLRLAVNTNAGREVLEIYRRVGLEGFFELIVTADDVDRPKPDEQGVELILAEFGLDPDRIVFIGDSIIDQQTAANAEVRFWAYNNPHLIADRHLDDYSKLSFDDPVD